MNRKVLDSLANELRRRRAELWKEVADAEEDLSALSEARESELEECAQEERDVRVLDRLDNRGKQEIEAIDAALRRIEDGSYGVCEECGAGIALQRLRALPATLLCVDCAQEAEVRRRAGAVGAPVEATIEGMSDEERQIYIFDRVREDGRVDTDALELECRHGVLYLSGSLSAESEHQVLRELLVEIGGVLDIVDRIEVRRELEGEGQESEGEGSAGVEREGEEG